MKGWIQLLSCLAFFGSLLLLIGVAGGCEAGSLTTKEFALWGGIACLGMVVSPLGYRLTENRQLRRSNGKESG